MLAFSSRSLADSRGNWIGLNSTQGTLHDQQAQPFSEFAPCFRQQADLLKPERRMQSDGGDIHSTDASGSGANMCEGRNKASGGVTTTRRVPHSKLQGQFDS
jgi:hypothetical protein